MQLSKSWLIAAVIIALLYLAFPRHEIKVVSYSYPATIVDGIPQLNRASHGTAVVFRHDRWTGKVEFCHSTGIEQNWIPIKQTTEE